MSIFGEVPSRIVLQGSPPQPRRHVSLSLSLAPAAARLRERGMAAGGRGTGDHVGGPRRSGRHRGVTIGLPSPSVPTHSPSPPLPSKGPNLPGENVGAGCPSERKWKEEEETERGQIRLSRCHSCQRIIWLLRPQRIRAATSSPASVAGRQWLRYQGGGGGGGS